MTESKLLLMPRSSTRPVCDHVQAEAEPVTGGTGQADQLGDHPAAALLPEKLLQPGEIIVLFIKPSLWYIPLASLGSLAAIGGMLAVAWVISDWFRVGLGGDLVLAAVVLAGVRLFWQFLEWMSRMYVLTDRRIVRVYGVLRVHVFEAPLKHIQHTSAHYSIRERLFALGTIGFTTAGTAATEAYWQMIANPLDVHDIVVRTLNRYR